jgi:hypothetical protein
MKTTERTVVATWYDCDCEWTTKFCEEDHQHSAQIPVDVLEEYENNDEPDESDEYRGPGCDATCGC